MPTTKAIPPPCASNLPANPLTKVCGDKQLTAIISGAGELGSANIIHYISKADRYSILFKLEFLFKDWLTIIQIKDKEIM